MVPVKTPGGAVTVPTMAARSAASSAAIVPVIGPMNGGHTNDTPM